MTQPFKKAFTQNDTIEEKQIEDLKSSTSLEERVLKELHNWSEKNDTEDNNIGLEEYIRQAIQLTIQEMNKRIDVIEKALNSEPDCNSCGHNVNVHEYYPRGCKNTDYDVFVNYIKYIKRKLKSLKEGKEYI